MSAVNAPELVYPKKSEPYFVVLTYLYLGSTTYLEVPWSYYPIFISITFTFDIESRLPRSNECPYSNTGGIITTYVNTTTQRSTSSVNTSSVRSNSIIFEAEHHCLRSEIQSVATTPWAEHTHFICLVNRRISEISSLGAVIPKGDYIRSPAPNTTSFKVIHIVGKRPRS